MTESIKNQQRMEAISKKKANQKTTEKAAPTSKAQPTVAPIVNGQPGLTPSQRIFQEYMYSQQRQAAMQQQNLPILMQRMQEPMTVAKMMTQQREQEWMQKEQVTQQVKAQIQQQELAQIMPKNVAQDINEGAYLEPQRIQMLEQVYYGLPPAMQQQMMMAGKALTYEAPLRDYQGQFMDPRAMSAQNPLGDEINNVTSF